MTKIPIIPRTVLKMKNWYWRLSERLNERRLRKLSRSIETGYERSKKLSEAYGLTPEHAVLYEVFKLKLIAELVLTDTTGIVRLADGVERLAKERRKYTARAVGAQ